MNESTLKYVLLLLKLFLTGCPTTKANVLNLHFIIYLQFAKVLLYHHALFGMLVKEDLWIGRFFLGNPVNISLLSE